MKSPRVAVYLRVSTADQSTALQEAEVRAYLANRGWQDFRIFEDKATGTNCKREALKRLQLECRQRRFDVVLVWKLDRFARSLKDLILLLQELAELGIDFVSLRDNLDLTTSAGRLMLHLLGAFAEFEASIIRERVRAGISHAKSKGTRLGRPPTIDARKVAELRSLGWSLGKIARYLGVSKAGVHKTLTLMPVTNAVNKCETTDSDKTSRNL